MFDERIGGIHEPPAAEAGPPGPIEVFVIHEEFGIKTAKIINQLTLEQEARAAATEDFAGRPNLRAIRLADVAVGPAPVAQKRQARAVQARRVVAENDPGSDATDLGLTGRL